MNRSDEVVALVEALRPYRGAFRDYDGNVFRLEDPITGLTLDSAVSYKPVSFSDDDDREYVGTAPFEIRTKAKRTAEPLRWNAAGVGLSAYDFVSVCNEVERILARLWDEAQKTHCLYCGDPYDWDLSADSLSDRAPTRFRNAVLHFGCASDIAYDERRDRELESGGSV